MNIGNLKANADGVLIGRITTLSLTMTIALRAVSSTNEKAPAYDVMALSADKRSWVKVGALWEYASTETGEMFLSGRLDDPSLDKPVDVGMFRQDDGSYNVAWRRPQRRSTLPAATTGAGSELPPFPGEATDAPGGGSPTGGGDGLGESTAPDAVKGEDRQRGKAKQGELVDA